MPKRGLNNEAQQAAKARYYDKGRESASLTKRRWTPPEIQLLLNKPAGQSDEELAALLKRPIMGVQVKRSKLLAAFKAIPIPFPEGSVTQASGIAVEQVGGTFTVVERWSKPANEGGQ